LFNEHLFKLEKREYVEEKIDVADFKFVDNQPAIELIEKVCENMAASFCFAAAVSRL